ncbi:hypothetical protein BDZ89DRAFT_1139221 [Hymenopellis radicata]|nr:hypothetical protein BDZ89DRAFT_1139221 [Hymenopellis radicata]
MPPFRLSPAARTVFTFIAIRLGSEYLKKNFPDPWRPQLRFPDPSAPPVTSEAAHKAAHRLSIATGPHSESLIAAVVACSPRSRYSNALPVARYAPIDGEKGATRQIPFKDGISPCDLLLANKAFRPGSCPRSPFTMPPPIPARTRALSAASARLGELLKTPKRPESIDQILNPTATHLSTRSFFD